MQNFKESWQNMPGKTRNIIKAIAAGTVAIALVAIIALNLTKDKGYGTLFTGLSQEEAQEVAALLQTDGVAYIYEDGSGSIRVPQESVDQTRATLLSQGYPKNGFAYDMYLDNTGLMTTESDKERISVYDLQDRLGATIRLFEGVQDAKVNVVMAQEQRYALDDVSGMPATASVVVTMKNGSALTADKAQAVRNLIAHSVRGMNFTNVTVYDAATMLEVGGDQDGSSGSFADITSLTTLVESNIAANVRRVLEKLYGTGNVEVSVKGTLNMERLIQEVTQYSTPEKIDEEDKTGLLQQEDLTGENVTAMDQAAGGLVGADANADTPRYTNEDGTEATNGGYSNGTASRIWLYNTLKEQRQIDPGVLEDTTIGVVILTDDVQSVTQQDLLRLVANSAGIAVDTVADKVTIIRAPGPQTPAAETPGDTTETGGPGSILIQAVPLPVLIAIGAGILLLILLILLLLIRRKRKKVVLEGDLEEDQQESLALSDLGVDENGQPVMTAEGGVASMPDAVEEEFAHNEELLNLRMKRSLRLKQNIGDFVDQNPQIAAKLIQTWLSGEEENDGRSSTRKRAK